MISLCGIAIFLFGNKLNDGKIIEASGVVREFEIANELGNFCFLNAMKFENALQH